MNINTTGDQTQDLASLNTDVAQMSKSIDRISENVKQLDEGLGNAITGIKDSIGFLDKETAEQTMESLELFDKAAQAKDEKESFEYLKDGVDKLAKTLAKDGVRQELIAANPLSESEQQQLDKAKQVFKIKGSSEEFFVVYEQMHQPKKSIIFSAREESIILLGE